MKLKLAFAVIALTGLLMALPARAAEASKPNILLIVSDDTGYGDLGVYGGGGGGGLPPPPPVGDPPGIGPARPAEPESEPAAAPAASASRS